MKVLLVLSIYFQVSIVSLVSEVPLSRAITCGARGTMWDLNTGISQHYSDSDPLDDGPVAEFLGRPLEDLPLSSLYIRHRLTYKLSNQSDDSFTMGDASSDITDVIDGRDWELETAKTGKQIVRSLMTYALKLKLEKYKDTVLHHKGMKALRACYTLSQCPRFFTRFSPLI